MGPNARWSVLAYAGLAGVLAGCGLVLDFDPEPRALDAGASSMDAGTEERRDASRRRDAAGEDGGGEFDAHVGPDAGRSDAGRLDAGHEAGTDGGDTDAGPPPDLCLDPSGAGPCTGLDCDPDGCGPVTGDRCEAGVCVCGSAAACRADRHEICDGLADGCSCEPGFADCDDTVPGCETFVLGDSVHCGACGVACGDGSSCIDGSCRACLIDIECADLDALLCTVPACDAGECVERLEDGACLIDGACFAASEPRPDASCQLCDPNVSVTDWTAAVDQPCDDGDACTDGDVCDSEGACVAGDTVRCPDPGDACHEASCDPTSGCTVQLAPGWCSIGGACVPAEQPVSPTDPCIVCDPDVDPSGWTSRFSGQPCDDGIPCTTESSCGLGAACVPTRWTACLSGRTCVAPGSNDPTNDCRVCANMGSSTGPEFRPRTSGTACEARMAGPCTYGAACTGSGTCAPLSCEGSSTRGLVCTGGTCHCADGRFDCDDVRVNGCECAGTSCSVCTMVGG